MANNATGSTEFYPFFEPQWSIPNITIPDTLVEVFTSETGKLGNTVSGAFDIQPRQYGFGVENSIMNGSPFPIVLGRALEYVLLDDKIEAVEGLIVDTRPGNASLGFRNHTFPQTEGNGATWTEVIPVLTPP